MSSKNFIVITACKNEEENLPELADSIINQTIKPISWVIFDDGSTDNTPKFLKDLELKYDWIYVIDGGISDRDLGFHYAEIIDAAIKRTLAFYDKRLVNIDYIGLIDADMILDVDFFEKMLNRLEEDPRLGVISGSVVYKVRNKIIIEKNRDNLPIGGLRMWRRECFDDIGGFPRSYSADAVSNVLAMLYGWDTKIYNDIIGVQTRLTSSAQGLWNGFKTRGESDYYRDYHPAYVFLKFIKYLLTYPFYTGFSYLYAYIKSMLIRKEKIDSPEIRKYYRNKHMEIIKYYLCNRKK